VQKRDYIPTALKEGTGMAPAAIGIWTWGKGWNACPDGAWFPAWFPSVPFPGGA